MDMTADDYRGRRRHFTVTYLGETLYAGSATDFWDAMAKIPAGHKVNSLTVALSTEVERGSEGDWDGLLHVVESESP